MTRVAVPLLVTLALLSGGAARAAESNARTAAARSITGEEVKAYVAALADDTFEGRESNTRGNRAAGIYIIQQLKKSGVSGGAAKGSFYQNFPGYSNILGLVEGSDPKLKDQVILIGAHYDHVGYGNARNSYGPTGLIHNGADDNASGVAGLLAVGDALGKLPERPRRSILLAFWDGEEKGLIGSQHWAEQPTVPLDHVPIAINADMIGRLRNSRIELYGSRTGRGLRQLVSRQNDLANLWIDFTWEMKPDSDHHTFFSRSMPVVMMHTGMHGDYHRPSDDADKVNADGLARVAQLIFSVAMEFANAPEVPRFRQRSRSETRGDQQLAERAQPAAPGRLGIRWDETAAARGNIVVAAINTGSAAERGGVRVGDRLLSLGGQKIVDANQLRSAVLAAKNPVAAVVERAGETEPRTLSLELTGSPVRLGISWRTDEAEPGVVIVNRLAPGSSAELAGIRVNDRILQINGQDFNTSDEFQQLARQAADPLTLLVETQGHVRPLEIPPAPKLESAAGEASAPSGN